MHDYVEVYERKKKLLFVLTLNNILHYTMAYSTTYMDWSGFLSVYISTRQAIENGKQNGRSCNDIRMYLFFFFLIGAEGINLRTLIVEFSQFTDMIIVLSSLTKKLLLPSPECAAPSTQLRKKNSSLTGRQFSGIYEWCILKK